MKLKQILNKYIRFLYAHKEHSGGVSTFLQKLNEMKLLLNQSENITAKEILKLYGGMGSINDLVFHTKGKTKDYENKITEKYYELNEELYQKCKEIINKKLKAT